MFSLEQFLVNPSLELIAGCKKNKLLLIANHYGISVPKQVVKSELKALVVEKLVELEVIHLPVAVDPGVQDVTDQPVSCPDGDKESDVDETETKPEVGG